MTHSRPIRFDPGNAGLTEELENLKRCPGVYKVTFRGAPPYISWSTNLERRLRRYLLPSAETNQKSFEALRSKIDFVECWPTGSRLESSILLYGLAKEFYPERYLQFLKLRMPWFLQFAGVETFARLEIANRVNGESVAWGPFFSRALAQQYQEGLLGLFQLRQCTETLVAHPEHPGCIYGEMSQCLRPCQGRVTREEYQTEVSRVEHFLRNNGRSAISLLASARDRACDAMEFEGAAQMHKRLERARSVAQVRDAAVNNVSEFAGVALTRSAKEGGFTLWPMVGGYWQDPVGLDLADETLRTKSLDAHIRELLTARLTETVTGRNRGEDLALFSRWYYSTWRDGEWYPFKTLADLNYRRLVRGLSKMAKGDAPGMGNPDS